MRVDKAIIYETPAAGRHERIVRDSPSGRLTIVAVSAPDDLPALAAALVAEGTRLIELCGGISPTWRHKVADAVGDAAYVSSVTFGIESLPAAAAYNAAYRAGTPLRDAFVFIEAGADPRRDRFVVRSDGQETIFVPVPDDDSGAEAAADLCAEGVALIELYGGFGTRGIARVIEAVDGRAPVGAGSFALDAIGFDRLRRT